jgi:hypothetical protein
MDPHKNEYAGAVAGMNETYGTAAPAVGDFVSGMTGGRRWSGHVEWFENDRRMVVNVGGAWVTVSPQDITH